MEWITSKLSTITSDMEEFANTLVEEHRDDFRIDEETAADKQEKQIFDNGKHILSSFSKFGSNVLNIDAENVKTALNEKASSLLALFVDEEHEASLEFPLERTLLKDWSNNEAYVDFVQKVDSSEEPVLTEEEKRVFEKLVPSVLSREEFYLRFKWIQHVERVEADRKRKIVEMLEKKQQEEEIRWEEEDPAEPVEAGEDVVEVVEEKSEASESDIEEWE